MKKFTLFYPGLLMVFALVEGATAQVARPESNSGKGSFILDGKLYDASGNEFIPMGANTAVFWQSETNGMKSFPDMKKADANCARIVSVTNNSANSWSWQSNFTKQKACVKACVDNKLVPILEFHDVTCGNGYDTDAESNKHGIGWLFWAWNSNPNETYYDIVANYTKGYTTEADLTEHGKFIVQQYKENAKEAKAFLPTSTSMIELDASQSILLYPNPLTSNVLNIDYRNIENEGFEQIQLKNIVGRTVKNIQIDDVLPGQLVLDGIASGTYFLCFRNEQKSYTSKLLITN